MSCGCEEECGKSGKAAHGYSTLYEVLLTGWLAAFAGRKTVSKNDPRTVSPAGPSPAPWKKSCVCSLLMNFGVVLSTTLDSLMESESLAIAGTSSFSGMLTMVFGRRGGLRRALVSCATRIGAGLGSFCGIAETCGLVFFFGEEEQELKLKDTTLKTKAKLARERPRCNAAESADFWSVDLMGRI